MPLSPPSAARTLKHIRSVQLYGYRRDDGCLDIEARLTDVKDHDYQISSGLRKKGEPVHDMWIRATVNAALTIVDIEACTDGMPFVGVCNQIAPAYRQLLGLNLFDGFHREIKARLSGIKGCSHLSELVMFLPTAALQTLASDVVDNADSTEKPFQLDRCHALDSQSEVVQRHYPRWYRGSKTG